MLRDSGFDDVYLKLREFRYLLRGCFFWLTPLFFCAKPLYLLEVDAKKGLDAPTFGWDWRGCLWWVDTFVHVAYSFHSVVCPFWQSDKQVRLLEWESLPRFESGGRRSCVLVNVGPLLRFLVLIDEGRGSVGLVKIGDR